MKTFVATFIVCFAVLSACAQEGVPNDMLQRTVLIKFENEMGTGFVLAYEGKAYIVTAHHVVRDLKDGGAIQVQRPEGWKDYHVAKILLPTCGEADVAVLDGDEVLPPSFSAFPTAISQDDEGPMMGQQVWFIGYPFGLSGRSPNSSPEYGSLPFIKRGTMSAIDSSNPRAVVVYIDGFNNPGFSGGPIMYWNFKKNAYRILGVVQGYREDSAKVLVNGQHVDTNLLVNSGILVGYSVTHAIQAIKQEPCPVKK